MLKKSATKEARKTGLDAQQSNLYKKSALGRNEGMKE
jgi:hypothetical protein